MIKPSFLVDIVPLIMLTNHLPFTGAIHYYKIISCWTITSIQLALLAKTLPMDQERMEKELATYAMSTIASTSNDYGSCSVDDGTIHCDLHSRSDAGSYGGDTLDGDISLFSIENQATSFDGTAVRQTLRFMGGALREISDNLTSGQICGDRNVEAKGPAIST